MIRAALPSRRWTGWPGRAGEVRAHGKHDAAGRKVRSTHREAVHGGYGGGRGTSSGLMTSAARTLPRASSGGMSSRGGPDHDLLREMLSPPGDSEAVLGHAAPSGGRAPILPRQRTAPFIRRACRHRGPRSQGLPVPCHSSAGPLIRRASHPQAPAPRSPGVHDGGMREIRFDRFGGPEVLTLHEDAPPFRSPPPRVRCWCRSRTSA